MFYSATSGVLSCVSCFQLSCLSEGEVPALWTHVSEARDWTSLSFLCITKATSGELSCRLCISGSFSMTFCPRFDSVRNRLEFQVCDKIHF